MSIDYFVQPIVHRKIYSVGMIPRSRLEFIRRSRWITVLFSQLSSRWRKNGNVGEKKLTIFLLLSLLLLSLLLFLLLLLMLVHWRRRCYMKPVSLVTPCHKDSNCISSDSHLTTLLTAEQRLGWETAQGAGSLLGVRDMMVKKINDCVFLRETKKGNNPRTRTDSNMENWSSVRNTEMVKEVETGCVLVCGGSKPGARV